MNAVERYQKKVGLVSKSYKLKKDLVETFSKKCEERGSNQSKELTRFMKNYIDGIE